jgi:hypothetical protein
VAEDTTGVGVGLWLRAQTPRFVSLFNPSRRTCEGLFLLGCKRGGRDVRDNTSKNTDSKCVQVKERHHKNECTTPGCFCDGKKKINFDLNYATERVQDLIGTSAPYSLKCLAHGQLLN